MTVMAYELIQARVPTELVPMIVARGWHLSGGDDQYRSLVADPELGPLVGAYAISYAARAIFGPAYGEPSMRQDAGTVAQLVADPDVAAELLDEIARVDDWTIRLAHDAVANPSPGVTPFDLTMRELDRPIPDRRDSITYRMVRVDGALDAVRNRLN